MRLCLWSWLLGGAGTVAVLVIGCSGATRDLISWPESSTWLSGSDLRRAEGNGSGLEGGFSLKKEVATETTWRIIEIVDNRNGGLMHSVLGWFTRSSRGGDSATSWDRMTFVTGDGPWSESRTREL